MTFTAEQNEALSAKLDAKHIKPPPKGKYGEYVPAFHIIAEANRIFGFDGWSYNITQLKVTNEGWRKVKDQRGDEYDRYDCGYFAIINVTVGDVIREDIGHGQGYSKTNEGDAHDSAAKEAVTDGLKRCLRTFGNPFGLALYDKAQEGVERSNGARRPAPHDEAIENIEARLVKAIHNVSTPIALGRLTSQDSFSDAINGLDAAARTRVEKAVEDKRGALNA